MPKFIGETCTVCKKVFAEQDDIVVCPICGTPHHRECWFEGGDCVNKDKHAEGYVWSPSNTAPQTESSAFRSDSNTPGHICPVCGSNNSPDNLFCPTCGQPRDMRPDAGESKNPYVSFFNPYAGKEIEGVPAEELAQFINSGAGRYISKFAEKKHGGWNWGAFFLGPLWFFFRKMSKIGAVLLMISISLGFMFSAPVNEYIDMTSSVMAPLVDSETGMPRADITEQEAETALADMNQAMRSKAAVLTYVFYGLNLTMNIFCAAFANRAYRKHCLSCVKEIRAMETTNPLEKRFRAVRKGGVSFLNLFAALTARSLIFYIVSTIVMML